VKRAALGFRVHSGWTSLVAISIDDGSPFVLMRLRPHLVETFTLEFRQPYHTAKNRPHDEACDFILRVQAEARRLAYQTIHAVQAKLQSRGYILKNCGLLLSAGKPLPNLTQILASHALIHTADGQLFREAVLSASQDCGLATFTDREYILAETACQTLHLRPNGLTCRLTDLGSGLGPPWSQDEKLSALVAWLSLLGCRRGT
jgi:hypothetical protein